MREVLAALKVPELYVSKAAATAVARWQGGGVTTYAWASPSGGLGAIGTETNHPFGIYVNNTEVARFDADGNIVVGDNAAGLPNGGGIVIFRGDYPRLTLKNTATGDGTGDGGGLVMVGTDLYLSNDENGNLIFRANGGEQFRIAPGGQLGINGANYGTAGQALTSNGPDYAPSWQTPGGSAQVTDRNTAGQTITINANAQQCVFGDMQIDGALDIQGRLVFL